MTKLFQKNSKVSFAWGYVGVRKTFKKLHQSIAATINKTIDKVFIKSCFMKFMFEKL